MASELAPLIVQWPAAPLHEADSTPPARRVQRAARAAAELVRDFRRLEGETAAQVLARLQRLKRDLLARLLGGLAEDAPGVIDTLLRQVDQLIADAVVEIMAATSQPFRAAAVLGQQAGDQPVRALQIEVPRTFQGRDDTLVRTATDNTLDLLTPPMRQFATDIRTGLRRIAVAGDQRMEEIQRLQKVIAAKGLDQAAFRAERIVRTELGRIFSEATHARLTDLAKTFGFLKKAWKATNDRRTRLGHREAGQTYGRGKGIPIAERFQVAVYDERAKAGPTRLGVAALRFPIDPLATPAGRLAAAATILCRCHAVVDVDVSRFAEFSRAQVQFALGGQVPPLPPSVPPSTPPPQPYPLWTGGTPRVVRRPRAATPTAAVRPVSRALGTPVSSAVTVAGGPYRKVSTALAVIDQVHGDGVLPPIPAGAVNQRISRGAMAYYSYQKYTGAAGSLGFTQLALREMPFMTVFHETGHFLDHQGLGFRQYASLRAHGRGASSTHAIDGVREVLTVLESTAPLRVLQTWRLALLQQGGHRLGQHGVPTGLQLRFVNYMLEPEEQFARAYAQYVTLRSAHPAALAELRAMQAAAKATVEGLRDGAPRSQTSFWKATHTPGAWQYPWQWQDDEFAPIAEAFDRLFEGMGWRRPGA